MTKEEAAEQETERKETAEKATERKEAAEKEIVRKETVEKEAVGKEKPKKEKLWNSNYTKIWTANFMLYFSFMLLMPLFPLYLRDTFGASKEAIGIVLSGYTVAALVIRPFSGYMVDRLPRKAVLIGFNFFFVALFAGYLAASSITLFAIFRTMHGIPFGATTVAGTTVAVDVLYPTRRAEGLGYYGLSNNIATAISPTIALLLLHTFHSYELLFGLSLVISFFGLIIDYNIKLESTEAPQNVNTRTSDLTSKLEVAQASKNTEEMTAVQSSAIATVQTAAQTAVRNGQISQKRIVMVLNKLFLLRGWSLGLSMICFALSYGVISTYVAIYAAEELGIKSGAGIFFLLLAGGLALSRLTGAKGLRQGRIVHNASEGMIISLAGYLLFALVHHPIALYVSALTIGLGNGHMYPAYQNMFINLATTNQRGTANSTLLTSWDLGSGLGVLLGGIVAGTIDYHAAFWMMWTANLLGTGIYFAYAKGNYLRKVQKTAEATTA